MQHQGQAAGTIKTYALKSELGWINEGKGEAGESFQGAGPEGLVDDVNCEGTVIRTRGSVIGAISPLNSMTSKGTLTFKQEGGAQVPEHLEGEPQDTLEVEYPALAPGIWFAANVTITAKTKDGEKGEIGQLV